MVCESGCCSARCEWAREVWSGDRRDALCVLAVRREQAKSGCIWGFDPSRRLLFRVVNYMGFGFCGAYLVSWGEHDFLYVCVLGVVIIGNIAKISATTTVPLPSSRPFEKDHWPFAEDKRLIRAHSSQQHSFQQPSLRSLLVRVGRIGFGPSRLISESGEIPPRERETHVNLTV